MSKEVKVIKCAKCDKVLFRKETGNIRNGNGTMSVNTQLYFVKETECPYCEGVADHEKSKMAN